MPERPTNASDPLRRDAVDAWMTSSRGDLASASALSRHRDEETSPSAAAFHAQQAAEKAIKALLLDRGISFPRVHDLSLLVGLQPDEDFDEAVADLTKYAVEQRYPTGLGDPLELNAEVDWPEADQAIATARSVVEVVDARLIASRRSSPPRSDMSDS